MADLAEAKVNPEVDRIFFRQPESNAASAARKQIAESYVGELPTHSTESGKSNGAEPSEEALNREGEAVLPLKREHPPILISSRRIPAHIAAGPEQAEVINRDVVSRCRTTHAAKGNHLVFVKADVFIEVKLGVLIDVFAAKACYEEIRVIVQEKSLR